MKGGIMSRSTRNAGNAGRSVHAPQHPQHQNHEGSRMSYWIADVLLDARERHGITEGEMATSLGVNWRTIRRLEKGESMGRDIDRFVAQYAYVCGIPDARDLWTDAIAAWRKYGEAPGYEAIDGPAAAFAQAIRTQAQATIRSRGDDAERPGRRRASR